jgi:hypothetical protein
LPVRALRRRHRDPELLDLGTRGHLGILVRVLACPRVVGSRAIRSRLGPAATAANETQRSSVVIASSSLMISRSISLMALVAVSRLSSECISSGPLTAARRYVACGKS